MSSLPDRVPTPTDAPECKHCPDRESVLVAYRCPHAGGANHLRRMDAACCLPPDVRRRIVREVGRFDGARAHRLAGHFGLPRGLASLD